MNKRLALAAFLLASTVVAQNPLSERHMKSDASAEPSFPYQLIDGRLSDEPLFFKPQNTLAAIHTEADVKNTIHWQVRRCPLSGQAIWIERTNEASPQGPQVFKEYQPTKDLPELKSILGLEQQSHDLRPLSMESDEFGWEHIKLEHRYLDVPVHASTYILHVQNGALSLANGRISPIASEWPSSMISTQQALQLADDFLISEQVFRGPLLIPEEPTVELIWLPTKGKEARLCYRVLMRPNALDWYRLFIDAEQAQVLKWNNLTCHIDGPKTATAKDLKGQNRSIHTYQKGSRYYMIDASRPMFNASRSSMPDNPVGGIWTIDAQNTYATRFDQISSTNNSWNNPTAVSAHANAAEAYEYYRNVHGRNAINGSGGTIISVINVSDERGNGFDNAFWNGQFMAYGNGRFSFEPLAKSMDVAGHEMTHGVISSTANLEYEDQAGAINESFADVFGAMMDREDWKIGEDVVRTNYYPSGALRDMSDPHNGGDDENDRGWQPKRMSEFVNTDENNGGVHTNSGIPNHACYLIAQEIGRDKTEKIYYRCLTTYMNPRSQFLDLRYGIEQSAVDLYGENGIEHSAVLRAFDQVEIFDPNRKNSGGTEGSDLPINPGNEYLLSYDTDPFNVNTLYRSSTGGTDYLALSSRSMKRKPSVPDQAGFAIYVDQQDRIRSLQLQSPNNDNVISPDAIWDNAAISKDGKMLAAISTEIDTSIYVYRYDIQQWRKFKLYNPTFSQGLKTGGVLYADALEFDHSGEYLIYDAFNQLENPNGEDLEYWDVGIIRIWNHRENKWGDGKIEKVFTQLEDGVNIGNPTFSKNSTNIIAFDYINTNDNTFAIIGHNLNTAKSNVIRNNVKLGYPNFSNKDDKLLFDSDNINDEPVVAVIPLLEDKISSGGTA
jgi:bacillolysin